MIEFVSYCWILHPYTTACLCVGFLGGLVASNLFYRLTKKLAN